MARKRGATNRTQAVVLLDATWQELRCFEPQSERHKALHAQALTNFNELSNARTSRLSTSQLRIPSPLRYLLYIGAVVLVASMWLMAVDVFTVHAIITARSRRARSRTCSTSIEDLDDAFPATGRCRRTHSCARHAFTRSVSA